MSELSRLRWRCRRGIKEMDIVLQQFLEQRYPKLSSQQQANFNHILDESDLDIMDWILGRSAPEHSDYDELIGLFRQHKPEL
jgi:antitoxin CptB